jgi:hypothetical protein
MSDKGKEKGKGGITNKFETKRVLTDAEFENLLRDNGLQIENGGLVHIRRPDARQNRAAAIIKIRSFASPLAAAAPPDSAADAVVREFSELNLNNKGGKSKRKKSRSKKYKNRRATNTRRSIR